MFSAKNTGISRVLGHNFVYLNRYLLNSSIKNNVNGTRRDEKKNKTNLKYTYVIAFFYLERFSFY